MPRRRGLRANFDEVLRHLKRIDGGGILKGERA